jgi:signal transduction histidine kinase
MNAATLAHEMGNLLGVINVYTDLLRRSIMDEAQKDHVREIERASQRAAALLREASNAESERIARARSDRG